MELTSEQVAAALRRGADGAFRQWGRRSDRIDEVVVSWAATVELLGSLEDRAAVVVTRAHPFYASPTLFNPADLLDEAAWDRNAAGDLVVTEKRRLLSERAMTVMWAPGWWDARGPASPSLQFAEAAGLAGSVLPTMPGAVVADVPSTTFGALLEDLLPRWGSPRALVTGRSDGPVSRVGFVAGVAAPAQLEALITEAEVTAVIVGETVEWEGTPFATDLLSLGWRVPVAAVGTAMSEQCANEEIARRLRIALPGVPIRTERLGESTWTPAELNG